MDEEKRLSRKTNILFSVIAVALLCVLLFPLYWALITSLKTEQEIFQNPPTFYPHILNTKSYAAQVETGDFNMFRSFANSFLISMGNGHRGSSGGARLLRDCQVSFQSEKGGAALLSGDADAAGVGALNAHVHHV